MTRFSDSNDQESPKNGSSFFAIKIFLKLFGLASALITAGFLFIGITVILAYPNLPDLKSLTNYRPKMPLRVYTADNVLIGEFGEERRKYVQFKNIPDIMKKAVLAIEDDRFYQHGGVDYQGILRAAIHNLSGGPRQGASTITQQVARNFFLSNEQTFKRKIYEALMAWKIEQTLSKNQILELYMNQIYLGQHAYGFAAAAQTYFGVDLKNIDLAQAAMLAGLPKAPSANNPISNPKRAKIRQQYILQRMYELGYITQAKFDKAKNEVLNVRNRHDRYTIHADYAAEMARQLTYSIFKDDTYTNGFNVYTTINAADQEAAWSAVRRGLLDYDRRHGYRGPEGYVNIPSDKEKAEDIIESALTDHPDNDNIFSAVVLFASPKKLQAVLSSGEEITLGEQDLAFASSWLEETAAPNHRIRRGSIIRVIQNEKSWLIAQIPQIESAFVAMAPQNGAIQAIIGGLDFDINKFNRVTQAWRQPGSGFKPFIYSAALEKGMMPSTIVNDSPISFSSGRTGGPPWQPKNSNDKFMGPINLRTALKLSVNVAAVRVLNRIGAKYGQNYITRFGFEAEKNPAYLTLALGAGAVTPMQMAVGYSAFANGGYKINPFIITKITNSAGQVLAHATPATSGDPANLIIDPRNAFIIDSMLRDVIQSGTGRRALSLNRADLAGKTGTTNDAMDSWFNGYQPQLVAVVWVGFDKPKSLGNHEYGATAALPIWIDFMKIALKNISVAEYPVPEGVIEANSDFYYAEDAPGQGRRVKSIDASPHRGTPSTTNNPDEIKNELF